MRRGMLRNRDKPPYALPTIFTVGTLFCGYFCLMKTVQAISLGADEVAQAAILYNHAAIAIGLAVFTDGVDGRIARATGAVSDFGREIDSLADCITFGVAPATLAFAWGVRGLELQSQLWLADLLPRLGYLLAFLYLTCGAARLARFNVQTNPKPKNPGRPGKRYFVGLPIPPAAGMLAAVVHARGGYPIESWWPAGVLWLALIALLAYLMVSTWRYSSMKDLGFSGGPLLGFIFPAVLLFLIWNFSEPVLLVMATTYVSSGILSRIAWIWRKKKHKPPLPPEAEQPS